MTFGADAREWLARSIGAAPRRLDLVRMKGSTSSSVFLGQCSHSSKPQRFVLRVLDNPEWLADEPDLATHEAAALEEAQKAGLRAPSLAAYSSDDIGFGAPVALMSFIEGNDAAYLIASAQGRSRRGFTVQSSRFRVFNFEL